MAGRAVRLASALVVVAVTVLVDMGGGSSGADALDAFPACPPTQLTRTGPQTTAVYE